VKPLGIGGLLTLVVTGALALIWGPGAVRPGIIFGLLATGLQAAATAVLEPARQAPFDHLIARWGLGVGFRLGGVLLVALAVLLDRGRFPPLPTAFGFLGVMVPLLFLELRRWR